ncbi:MAG: hypothetical protein JWO06_3502, partial [Bacteroidota bacterium]|nr:hypothetical protein [Bacteroidota bacterium]
MAKTIFIGMGTSVDNKLLETIEQILKLNLKLVGTTVPGPDKISMDQKQLDTILAGLNNVSNELDEKSRFIEWRTNRLNEIVEVLLKYTLMDFSIKLDISDRGDELDAIALGLNTLGEELDSHISRLKEKTEGLERSNKQLEQFVYVAS